MKDISKDVLQRLEELSERLGRLEREMTAMKKEESESLAYEEGIDLGDEAFADFVVEPGFEDNLQKPEHETWSASEPDFEPEEDSPTLDTPEPVSKETESLPVEDEAPDLGLFGGGDPQESTGVRKRVKKVGMDLMSDGESWRTDMPGPVVKDIRSGISLNDRVMFINRLFRKDSVLFQDTLSRMNVAESLGEAVKYLKVTFPEWYWDSEMVYRFMMCVRRKLR